MVVDKNGMIINANGKEASNFRDEFQVPETTTVEQTFNSMVEDQPVARTIRSALAVAKVRSDQEGLKALFEFFTNECLYNKSIFLDQIIVNDYIDKINRYKKWFNVKMDDPDYQLIRSFFKDDVEPKSFDAFIMNYHYFTLGDFSEIKDYNESGKFQGDSNIFMKVMQYGYAMEYITAKISFYDNLRKSTGEKKVESEIVEKRIEEEPKDEVPKAIIKRALPEAKEIVPQRTLTDEQFQKKANEEISKIDKYFTESDLQDMYNNLVDCTTTTKELAQIYNVTYNTLIYHIRQYEKRKGLKHFAETEKCSKQNVEIRSRNLKQMNDSRTPEERSEISRKGGEAYKAKREAIKGTVLISKPVTEEENKPQNEDKKYKKYVSVPNKMSVIAIARKAHTSADDVIKYVKKAIDQDASRRSEIMNEDLVKVFNHFGVGISSMRDYSRKVSANK